MRNKADSFAQIRLSNTSTPISAYTIRSRKSLVKQQKSIQEMFQDVKSKVDQMSSAYREQRTFKQRQMLKTYVKLLQKLGQEVTQSKQKYLNLNKQNLKTQKRLEIVTQLNNQRQYCNDLVKNIHQVEQQIKRYQDQNNFLQKQVQALQNIQKRKESFMKSQKLRLRTNERKARSLFQKQPQFVTQDQRLFFCYKKYGDLSHTVEMKNRVDSFGINLNLNQKDLNSQKLKQETRPFTQQKERQYLGNKRRINKFVNHTLQKKPKSSQFQ